MFKVETKQITQKQIDFIDTLRDDLGLDWGRFKLFGQKHGIEITTEWGSKMSCTDASTLIAQLKLLREGLTE